MKRVLLAAALLVLAALAPRASAQQLYANPVGTCTGGVTSSDGFGNTVIKFVASGTITCSQQVTATVLLCSGAGGGASGGGAGNCNQQLLTIPAGNTAITIGLGGIGGLGVGTVPAQSGGDSSIGALLTVPGGGGGQGVNQPTSTDGGGCGAGNLATCAASAGTHPFAGGSVTAILTQYGAGGGAGAKGPGASTAGGLIGGAGGLGITSLITGTSAGYGGGGGGGVGGTGTRGGFGGGGAGDGSVNAQVGISARENSGGGGGGTGFNGASNIKGGSGSNGVAIFSCPTVSCGAPTVITPFIGQIATRSYTPAQLITSTTGWNSRTCHYMRDATTQHQYVDVNWYNIPRTGETNPGGTLTVSRSVEYPAGTTTFTGTGSGTNLTASATSGLIRVGATIAGTGVPAGTTIVSGPAGGGNGVYVTSQATTASANALTSVSLTQVTWSAATSVTIADGGQSVSDAVSVTIPDGAYFCDRSFEIGTVGVVALDSHGAGHAISLTLGDAVNNSNIDGTMSGAAIVNSGVTTSLIPPAAIIGLTTRPSIGAFGSSRMSGNGDTIHDSNSDTGYTRLFGRYFAYIDTSESGDTVVAFSGSGGAKRYALVSAYTTHLWLDPGLNDFSLNVPESTVMAGLTSMASAWPGGATKVIWNNEAAWTGSTDGWITSVNQTPVSNVEPPRIVLNAAINALTGYNQIVDANSIDGNGTNFQFWNNPAVGGAQWTVDGVHENTFALNSLVSAGILNPNLATLP